MRNTVKTLLLQVILVVVSFIAPGCDKDGNITPEGERQIEVLLSAKPSIIEFGKTTNITCFAQNAQSLIVKANDKIIPTQSTQAAFDQLLYETTTFEATAKTPDGKIYTKTIVVTVDDPDPRLKMFFAGNWRYDDLNIKIPGSSEFVNQKFGDCKYKEVVAFRPDGIFKLTYAPGICALPNSAETGVNYVGGNYTYSLKSDTVTVKWGDTFQIASITKDELKLRSYVPHKYVGGPKNGQEGFSEHITTYRNVP